MVTKQQIQLFLNHIKFKGKVELTEQCLVDLVEGFIFNCPYESLNIHSSDFDNKPHHRTSTTFNTLFNKIIMNKRGGQCVELSLLLQRFLSEFGFQTTRLIAHDMYEDLPKDKRHHHAVSIVNLNGKKYLVDAAFGSIGPLSPLLLKKGVTQQFSEKFNLLDGKKEGYDFILQYDDGEGWHNLYGFKDELKPAPLGQYYALDKKNRDLRYKDAFFSDFFLCSLPFKLLNNGNSRVKIYNNHFLLYEYEKKVKEEMIRDQTHFREILDHYFHFSLKDQEQIRFDLVAMQAYLAGINHPPILHQYATRLKIKYAQIAGLDIIPEDLKPAKKQLSIS